MIRTQNFWGGISARWEENHTWTVRIGLREYVDFSTHDAATMIRPAITFPGANVYPTYSSIVRALDEMIQYVEENSNA